MQLPELFLQRDDYNNFRPNFRQESPTRFVGHWKQLYTRSSIQQFLDLFLPALMLSGMAKFCVENVAINISVFH